MNETVDVLIPVYNGAKYVERCIKAVSNQTYTDISIIVLNDGSVDDSLKIVKRLATEDKRIKIFSKENKKSVSVARNYLLNKIESDYFIFVDADDVVSPTFIECLVKALKTTKSDMACCEYTLFKPSLDKSAKLKGTKIYDSRSAIPEFVLGGRGHYMLWNKLIKTSLIQNVRFNREVNYGEDLFFILDLMQNEIFPVVSIKNKLYYYKVLNFKSISKGGLTKNKKTFLETLIKYEKARRYGENTRVITIWIYLTATYFQFLLKANEKDREYKKYLSLLKKERKGEIKREIKRIVTTKKV